MANFNDIYKKYTVLGECYYNLETHELKSQINGKKEINKEYNNPVLISDFMEAIGDFIKRFSDMFYYSNTEAWIGFENKGEKITLSVIYDNK